MNPTTATPTEIDTQLQELYLREMKADQGLAAANARLHRALNERTQYQGRRQVWPTSDADALAACRAKVADPEYKEVPWGTSPAKALAAYDAATAELAAATAAQEPYHAEFTRRGGWSRFFTVQQHNGHIHSGMNCSTCNRNGSKTSFGWNPELSGLTEAEAVAKLGPNLCTVCFPTAPVEWTVGKPVADYCAGSGKAPAGNTRRVGMKTYGTCTECGEGQLVNDNGTVRKHKPPKN